MTEENEKVKAMKHIREKEQWRSFDIEKKIRIYKKDHWKQEEYQEIKKMKFLHRNSIIKLLN